MLIMQNGIICSHLPQGKWEKLYPRLDTAMEGVRDREACSPLLRTMKHAFGQVP